MAQNVDPRPREAPNILVRRRAGSTADDQAREIRARRPVATLIGRLIGAKTKERAWRKGAAGERLVARCLGRLPDGWHVVNDIPVGVAGANIDHLVIGPAGVFTVNTKNLSGRVWLAERALLVNGHRTDYLPKARHEADRAARLLSACLGRPVFVHPTLAILADGWTVKERPTDVYVESPRHVRKWLLDCLRCCRLLRLRRS